MAEGLRRRWLAFELEPKYSIIHASGSASYLLTTVYARERRRRSWSIAAAVYHAGDVPAFQKDAVSESALIYHSPRVPKPFRLLTVPREVATGTQIREIARALGTTAKRVQEVAAAADPIQAVFGISLDAATEDAKLAKARQGLGQMLLGTICERAFEDLYKETMGTTELRLEDTREGGTDTDYRVFNGSGTTGLQDQYQVSRKPVS